MTGQRPTGAAVWDWLRPVTVTRTGTEFPGFELATTPTNSRDPHVAVLSPAVARQLYADLGDVLGVDR